MADELAAADRPASFMSRWGALVALCLTMFIVVLDSTMMNVAVPQITEDLNTTVSAVQAVIASYSMIMASLMLAGAKLGTIYGPRLVFRVALLIYGVGTLLAAVSWNIEILFLGWSVIEGIAAAALIPLSTALVVFNYSGTDRALGFGILGGFQATAAAIGPIFGGFLTTTITWRAGFAFEVVIVVVVLAVFRYLKGPEGDRTQSHDLIGTVLSVLGLGSIVAGALLAGRHGWWTARRPLRIGATDIAPLGLSVTAWLILIGIGFLVAFAHWQLHRERTGRTPLVHMRLFANGTFVAGFTTDALQSVTLAGLLFVMPLFLIQVLGFNALGAGIALLPASIAVLVVSMTTPGLGSRIMPKSLVLAGTVLMGAGLFWMIEVIAPDMSAWSLTLPLLLFGSGTGLLLAQVPNLTLSSVEEGLSEEASGVQNAAKETGSSLGVAVIGSVLMVATLTGVVQGVLEQQRTTVSDQERDELVIALEDTLDETTEDEQRRLIEEADRLTGGRIETIVTDARIEGLKQSLQAIGGFVVLAFLAATFLPSAKLEDARDPAQPGAGRIQRTTATPQRGV